jgi:hypothetical protein
MLVGADFLDRVQQPVWRAGEQRPRPRGVPRLHRPPRGSFGGAPRGALRDALARGSCRTRDLPVDLTLAGTRLNCCAIHKLHRPNPRASAPLEISIELIRREERRARERELRHSSSIISRQVPQALPRLHQRVNLRRRNLPPPHPRRPQDRAKGTSRRDPREAAEK